MKRTNIYLEEEHLRLLKHIAVEEGLSFTELVRKALQQFLEKYEGQTTSPQDAWHRRLEQLLERVQQRSRVFDSEEIEAVITEQPPMMCVALETMLRVLVDTNVWVSAFLNPHGFPAQVLNALKEGRFKLILSEPLVNELLDVLTVRG